MSFLGESFDIDQMPVSERSYDLLPDGWYHAKITKADAKPTKDQSGQLIAVRYDIVGPTQQGRVIFANINIRTRNPEAERIGREQLGSVMRAIGLRKLEDTDQLIGGELQIKVKTSPAKDGYEARNDVSGFKALEGSSLPSASPTPQTQQSGGATPPWMKK
jgi:hypothetical protein